LLIDIVSLRGGMQADLKRVRITLYVGQDFSARHLSMIWPVEALDLSSTVGLFRDQA